MLKQSHIEQLIHNLCPNGVEYKELGELCIILDSKRKPVSKGLRSKGIYPYYGANGILDYVGDYIFDGTYLLLGEDGSVINEDKSPVLHWAVGKIWVNNHAHVLEEREDVAKLRYLFYVLQTIDVSDIVRGTPPKINQQNLRGIQLPLPPMPVQEEIVRILDSFTNLMDNIDTEINARQKQLENTIERLFIDVKDDWDEKSLGEIGNVIKGSGIQKSDFVEVGYPCIHYGQIHTYYGTSAVKTKSFISEKLYAKCKKAVTGDLVIATTSEDVPACCKATAWLGKENVAVSGDAHILHHNQDPLFMAYLFRTDSFAQQRALAARGTKVTRVSGDSLASFRFFFPPIAEQRAIAEKLDTIEAFINNLKTERDLRQQQYEYYREYLINLLK